MAQSITNNSNQLLTDTSIFEGYAENVINFASINVSCITDQNGLLYTEFSHDGTNWDHTETHTLVASTTFHVQVLVRAKYYRVRVENNSGSDQTYLRLQSKFDLNPTTVTLSTTDNSVLDDIALSVDNIDTNTTGLATEATLSTLDGKVTACDTGAVVIASGTVDLGAVDNAVLDSIATSVTSIDTKTNSLVFGGGLEASCQRVTLASDTTGVLTVNLGAVDNAVLDTIVTNTNDVATETTLTSLDTKISACDTGAVVVASGTVTANLGAVDNAVLDSIVTNTTGLATEATLGTLDGKVTACNTGAVVVASGTVTANLGAVDNAVLDSIDTNTTGLATEATLGTLDGKVTACNTGAVVIASGTTVATQSTHDSFNCNATLQISDTDLSLGQAVMVSSLPVTLASNQSTINVAQNVSAVYSNGNLSSTGLVVYAFAGKMNTLYIMNWAASVAFIRIYDKSTAALSSDTPVMTFTLYNYQNASLTFPCPIDFTNGISVRATTGVAEDDEVSPTSNAASCVIAYT